MNNRTERIKALQAKPEVSVLIIGAGINGVGTFRDLALQGLDVVMIDRGDYGSGTSAASSHMVHGGIRYLENGEFRLVREAVRERNRLIENVPHLVKPLPTTFPIFKVFSGLLNAPLKFLGLLEKPSERGGLVIKIGMTLYDIYTGAQKTVPKHVFKNRKETLAQFPALNPDVRYTGTYFDAAMPSPERIVVELIGDTVKANSNAIPLNYTMVEHVDEDGIGLKDLLNGETMRIKPKIVVNAGGPWIDLINASFGKQTRYMGGTKGSHLVLDHPELRAAIGANEIFFENKDGRIVLIFPLQDRVLVGTSDIRVDDLDHVVIGDDETAYFFDMVKHIFPGIHVDRSHIVYTFSGVRPLPYSDASFTGQISRDHDLKMIEPEGKVTFPILSMIGGKWTTFRAFAEQASDVVMDRLGLKRKVSTDEMSIGGSEKYPKSEAEKEQLFKKLLSEYALERTLLQNLFDLYGMKVVEILQKSSPESLKPLDHCPEISVCEIEYLVRDEDVLHLDDLILRRVLAGKLGKVNADGLQEIAEVCAKALGWTPEKTKEEVERFAELLRVEHRMEYNRYIG